MSQVVHIRIPVWSAEGWLGPELVEAREAAGGRFVILCPPRFAYGLAVGDEIELDATRPAGFRVTRHSRNLTIWVYCQTDASARALASASATLLSEISATLEGVPNGMLIITAPLAAGWSAIEAVMNQLVARDPTACCEYANVYDVEDGVTPLNWWLEPTGPTSKT